MHDAERSLGLWISGQQLEASQDAGLQPGSLRDECLNGEMFYTLKEAQVIVEAWRKEYNRIRPHSSLSYRPPAPLATISMLPLYAVDGLQSVTC